MNFNLSVGGHGSAKDGTCAMEAASILAGEPFSDNPTCVCHVISTFVRVLNDYLPDDETRNRLLLPLLPRLIGTRDWSKERARGYLAADYAVRVFAANALQAARLPDTLSRLPEIVDEQTAKAAGEAAHAAAAFAADASDYAALAARTATYATEAAAYYPADVAAYAADAAVHAINMNGLYAHGPQIMYAKAVELIEKMIGISE